MNFKQKENIPANQKPLSNPTGNRSTSTSAFFIFKCHRKECNTFLYTNIYYTYNTSTIYSYIGDMDAAKFAFTPNYIRIQELKIFFVTCIRNLFNFITQ